MKDTDHISFNETAHLLRKSRTTVYRLMANGLLTPHYRPKNPRSPVFLRSQVESLNVPGPREPAMNQALHKKVKQRDGKCVVCFYDGFSLVAHHVVPVEQGGPDEAANLATLCSMCHGAVHSDGIRLDIYARKNSTEAIANWLLRSGGLPEIDFTQNRAAG